MSPSPFCQCRLHPASSLSLRIYSCLHASVLLSVLFLCLTEVILVFGHADSECWSYSNTFSLSMLLNVSSKPTEVTHIDHRGAVTLALNNFKNQTEQPKTDDSFLLLPCLWLSVSSTFLWRWSCEGVLIVSCLFMVVLKTPFHSVEVTIFNTAD